VFGVKAVVYFEVFNLFNSKTFNYNYLFATANKIDGNTQLNYYELHPFDDPYYGVRWYDGETGPMSAYPVDHSFVLYQNAPRSYTFGLSLEF
jgi:hypothetical protein